MTYTKCTQIAGDPLILAKPRPDVHLLARKLVDTLPYGLPILFNPWKDVCAIDEPWNSPDEKLKRLAAHLNCDPDYIFCGEAPGHLGCRHSGIAFTSERQLLAGSIPRIPKIEQRLTNTRLSFTESSATVVWRNLHLHGIAEKTLLWNAVQLHPHQGNPASNRTPTAAEVAMGAPALRILTDYFPNAKVVAIGGKAAELLRKMNITPTATVRHPANGGIPEFESGIENLVK